MTETTCDCPTLDEPHPLVLFPTAGSKDIAAKMAYYLNVELGDVYDQPFANGESFAALNTDVRGRDVFVICSTCRRWDKEQDGRAYTGVNDSLMELLVFGDTIARASAWRITAVIPYFGYARQDRKARSRTPITARLVADMIQAAGYKRVLTMDLHTEQIQGFFDNQVHLDHLNAGRTFVEHFMSLGLDNAAVMSPDVGNLKKVNKYRKAMPGFSLAVIDKTRDDHGTEVNQMVGDVENKTVVIFDDIISTASTTRGAINFALEHGANDFFIGATHFEGVGNAIEQLHHPKIKGIVTTDTIPLLSQWEGKVKVLSVADLFGEAIIRIHRQESISELLGEFG